MALCGPALDLECLLLHLAPQQRDSARDREFFAWVFQKPKHRLLVLKKRWTNCTSSQSSWHPISGLGLNVYGRWFFSVRVGSNRTLLQTMVYGIWLFRAQNLAQASKPDRPCDEHAIRGRRARLAVCDELRMYTLAEHYCVQEGNLDKDG